MRLEELVGSRKYLFIVLFQFHVPGDFIAMSLDKKQRIHIGKFYFVCPCGRFSKNECLKKEQYGRPLSKRRDIIVTMSFVVSSPPQHHL